MILQKIELKNDNLFMSSREPQKNPWDLLSVYDAAEEKGLTVQALYKAMKPGGPLRSQKIGKITVIMRRDLDDWHPKPRGYKKGFKNKGKAVPSPDEVPDA